MQSWTHCLANVIGLMYSEVHVTAFLIIHTHANKEVLSHHSVATCGTNTRGW